MKVQEAFATEAGHWYDLAGQPFYTVIGANGQERPTTLRDARKLGLVPSVTTIMKEAAKPGLDVWKQQQVMLAALTLPRRDGEGEVAFCNRIIQDSKEQARKAAERGAELHGAIERAIQGREFDLKWDSHIGALDTELMAIGIDLYAGTSERSFAHPEGFGGKVDYSCETAIVDFKNKPCIEPDKKYAYDEHVQQLAAYRLGLGYGEETRLVSAFIGCDDGKIQLREWTNAEAERGLAMFRALLAYWKVKAKL